MTIPLRQAFERAESDQRAALIVYLCAGDPSMEATPPLLKAAERGGADLIEIGMPFSDPTADGPAIQRASERALRNGAHLGGLLQAVRTAELKVPVLLFGYYNPILAYGEKRLAQAAREAGIGGLLVVDMPPEDSADLRDALTAEGLDYVPLIAPTTRDDRARYAASLAGSFVYYVSMTGVTGAQSADLKEAARRAQQLAQACDRRVAVGFGIKTPADVALVAPHVDGVVVGSAVVSAIEQAVDADSAADAVCNLVKELAAATAKSR